MGQCFLMDRARVQLVIRVDAAHLFLSAKLGHRLHDRLHRNVGHSDTLVVVNLERLVDDLRGALDGKAFVGALALGKTLVSSGDGAIRAFLGLLLELGVFVC